MRLLDLFEDAVEDVLQFSKQTFHALLNFKLILLRCLLDFLDVLAANLFALLFTILSHDILEVLQLLPHALGLQPDLFLPDGVKELHFDKPSDLGDGILLNTVKVVIAIFFILRIF